MKGRTDSIEIERLKEVLSYDAERGVFTRNETTGRCGRWKAGSVSGHVNKKGYTQIWIDGKSWLAHRLAWMWVHGRLPTALIDHIDGNPANNRISNLRECDDNLNMQNIRKAHADNRLGLLGVRRTKLGRYSARIYVNKKEVSLGCFATANEAHEAYLKKKREVHEFCTI